MGLTSGKGGELVHPAISSSLNRLVARDAGSWSPDPPISLANETLARSPETTAANTSEDPRKPPGTAPPATKSADVVTPATATDPFGNPATWVIRSSPDPPHSTAEAGARRAYPPARCP